MSQHINLPLFAVLAWSIMCKNLLIAQSIPEYIPNEGLGIFFGFEENYSEVLSGIEGEPHNTAFSEDGQSVIFNGTTSYVAFPSEFFDGNDAMSTSTFYVKFTVNNLNNEQGLWNKDGNWRENRIRLFPDSSISLSWAYPNYYDGVRSTNGSILPNTEISAIFILDEDQGEIYLNGIEAEYSQQINTSSVISFLENSPCPSDIRCNRFGMVRWGGVPTRFFDGEISEFAIWDRALTACEIASISSKQSISDLAVDAGIDLTVCGGDSVIVTASGGNGDYLWSNGILNGVPFLPDSSGIYTVESGITGCLSEDTLQITVLSTDITIDSLTTCDSLTWIDGVTYTESTNSPTFVLQNAAGCDSTITLDLSVNYTTYNTIDTTAINSFEYNGEVYTEDGEYVVYLENQAGCDSVVTLKLDFEYVVVNDFVIDKGWVVYPNPAENRITIAFDSAEDAGHVTVHNQLGQEVWTDFVSRTYTLDVSDWPRGFYVFHYSGDRLRKRFSVVLE